MDRAECQFIYPWPPLNVTLLLLRNWPRHVRNDDWKVAFLQPGSRDNVRKHSRGGGSIPKTDFDRGEEPSRGSSRQRSGQEARGWARRRRRDHAACILRHNQLDRSGGEKSKDEPF